MVLCIIYPNYMTMHRYYVFNILVVSSLTVAGLQQTACKSSFRVLNVRVMS